MTLTFKDTHEGMGTEIRRLANVAQTDAVEMVTKGDKQLEVWLSHPDSKELSIFIEALDRAVKFDPIDNVSIHLVVDEDDPEVLKLLQLEQHQEVDLDFDRSKGELALMRASGPQLGDIGMSSDSMVCLYRFPLKNGRSMSYSFKPPAEGTPDDPKTELALLMAKVPMEAEHHIQIKPDGHQQGASLVGLDDEWLWFELWERDMYGGMGNLGASEGDFEDCGDSVVRGPVVLFAGLAFPKLAAGLASYSQQSK